MAARGIRPRDIQEGLEKAFGSVVKTIKNESAFGNAISSILKTEDSVVVMDILLRWADPAPDAPPVPPQVKKDGPYTAGVRCLDRLSEAGGRLVPIVTYTVLDAERKLAEHLRRLEKQFDRFRSLRKAPCGIRQGAGDGLQNGALRGLSTKDVAQVMCRTAPPCRVGPPGPPSAAHP